MSRIPLDLIFQMFWRLPVKTLIRFRCLSKPVCSLIDSPDFVKLHFNYSTSIKSDLVSLIVQDSGGLYSRKLDSLDDDTHHHYYREIISHETEVFGSCHGWLAMSNSEQHLFLFNPSCRKSLDLPAPGSGYNHLPQHAVFYGFGHDHVNYDYKVVKIVSYKVDYQGIRYTDYEANVFSLKNNSWRAINTFASCFRFISPNYRPSSKRKRNGVFVSGALHWLFPLRPEMGSGQTIIAFDLAFEEFRTLPLPDYGDDQDKFALDMGVLKGRLCAICKNNRVNLDVWMMNAYDESWSKLVSIQQSRKIGFSSLLNDITYSEQVGVGGGAAADKFLLGVHDGNRELLLYDPETDTHKSFRIKGNPRLFAAYICVESLLPLNDRPLFGTFLTAEKKKQPQLEEISYLEETNEEKISKEKIRKKREDFLSRGFKRFFYPFTRGCRMGRWRKEPQRVYM